MADDNLDDIDSKDFFLSAMVKEEEREAGLPREVMARGAEVECLELASMARNSVMEAFFWALLTLLDSRTFLLLMASMLFFLSTRGSSLGGGGVTLPRVGLSVVLCLGDGDGCWRGEGAFLGETGGEETDLSLLCLRRSVDSRLVTTFFSGGEEMVFGGGDLVLTTPVARGFLL